MAIASAIIGAITAITSAVGAGVGAASDEEKKESEARALDLKRQEIGREAVSNAIKATSAFRKRDEMEDNYYGY